MVAALRRRWAARRWELAQGQLQGMGVHDVGREPATDALTGRHALEARARGGLLNPKATTTTDWRGD